MSAFGTNACPQSNSPLINRFVNDRLPDAWPTVNQTLLQLIDISYRQLIDPIPQHCPYSVIHRIQVWAVGRPEFGRYGYMYLVRRLATKQLHGRVRTVCRLALLAELKLVLCFTFYFWKKYAMDDKKFIEVYKCAKCYDIWIRFHKVIAIIQDTNLF